MRFKEIVEGLNDRQVDKFHTELDKLVHKHLGHSSDEEEQTDEGRHDGNWHKDGVEMCSKECCGQPVTECTCGPDCPHCDCYEKNRATNESVEMMTEEQFDEAAGEKDACYHKVKSRYKVWPSAYASGALVKCRKVGAKNWGNKSKK